MQQQQLQQQLQQTTTFTGTGTGTTTSTTYRKESDNITLTSDMWTGSYTTADSNSGSHNESSLSPFNSNLKDGSYNNGVFNLN